MKQRRYYSMVKHYETPSPQEHRDELKNAIFETASEVWSELNIDDATVMSVLADILSYWAGKAGDRAQCQDSDEHIIATFGAVEVQADDLRERLDEINDNIYRVNNDMKAYWEHSLPGEHVKEVWTLDGKEIPGPVANAILKVRPRFPGEDD